MGKKTCTHMHQQDPLVGFAGKFFVAWTVSFAVPGGIQARISAIQILYEIFVGNLFGVFKDLCGYTLGIATAYYFS